MAEPITREEFHDALGSARREFNAGLTTAGVQIGALEKSLTEKLDADARNVSTKLESQEESVKQRLDSSYRSLRLWGALALIGGQAIAGLLASLVGSGGVAAPVRSAAGAVLRLL